MPKMETGNITLEYELIGEGFPVIFLHGSGVSWRCWKPQIPVFSSHYQMVLPNMRGHGESSPLPRTDHYHELMADDLKIFMDSLGIKRAHVVGLSMGAVVALRFAIKYPDCVDKLVSVCGYSEMPSKGAAVQLWLGNAIYSMMSMNAIMKNIDFGLKIMKAKELTRKVIKESIAINKETFIKLKFIRFPNFTDQLHKIKAPTLVMGGDGLKFEAKGSKVIYDHLSDARLAIFHGGFDPLSTECQPIHDELILEFLAGRGLKPHKEISLTCK